MSKHNDTSQSSKRSKLGLAALWLCLFASLATFAWATTIAISKVIQGWELEVFHVVNDWMPSSEVVSNVAQSASLTSWIAVFCVAGLYLFRKYKLAWRFSVGVVAAYGLTYIVEHLIMRERPPLIVHDMMERATQGGYGFPSGHAATTTVVALLLIPLLPRVFRIIPIIWIALVVWSRVYLGVHAPLDVIAGVALGVALVSFYYILPDRLLVYLRLNRRPVKRSHDEPEHHSDLANKALSVPTLEENVPAAGRRPASAPTLPGLRKQQRPAQQKQVPPASHARPTLRRATPSSIATVPAVPKKSVRLASPPPKQPSVVIQKPAPKRPSAQASNRRLVQ